MKVLNEESKTWINLENIENLQDNKLIPDKIYDETDYYLKLHEQSVYMHTGNFDAVIYLKNIKTVGTTYKW